MDTGCNNMNIAIASGKGGTGKTTVSVNLALSLDEPVNLLDCDVEEPNSKIFLDGKIIEEKTVKTIVPEINLDSCNNCGLCSDFCQFNAIALTKSIPLIFPEMCHNCGGCFKICPQNAIFEKKRSIGKISIFEKENVTLIEGKLNIGVVSTPPLIREVKKKMSTAKVNILDSPPGTTCPVITTINNTDFVVLVTEPTPFGLNDLKLAVDMVRELNIPFGIVINRAGIKYDPIYEYCSNENLSILLEIPYDRKIAEIYSKGEIIVDKLPEYRTIFQKFYSQIVDIIEEGRVK